MKRMVVELMATTFTSCGGAVGTEGTEIPSTLVILDITFVHNADNILITTLQLLTTKTAL